MEGEHVMGTVKEDLEKELFTQYREYMDVHSVREEVDSLFNNLDKHFNVLKDLYLIWGNFISTDDKEFLDFFSYISPIVSGLANALEVIGNELEFAPRQGLLHGTKRRVLRGFIRFAEIKAKRIEDAVNLLNRKDALESRGLSYKHVLNHILDEIGLLEKYVTGTVLPEELPEDIKSKIDLFIELLLKANCFIVNLSSNRRDEYPVDDLNRMFNGLFEVLSEVKGMIVYDVKASDRYLDTIGGH
jgi:hypothetical protein